MNSLFSFAISLVAALSICCSSGGTESGTDISVSPNPVTVSGEGGSIVLTVTADDEWGIYVSEPWATCSPTGGVKGSSTVTVIVAANPSTTAPRGAEIVIKSGSERFAVSLTQAASTPEQKPQMFVPDGYELTWSDEFDGTALNTSNWTPETGTGSGGWGNAELQHYTSRPENLKVEGGNLVITARKESFSDSAATSARLITMGKVFFKYGYVVASIRLPKTANGLWPAFWMMGNDFPASGWPRCGETDILEMGHSTGINNAIQERYLNGACHWGQSHANHMTWDYSLQDGEFHTYTCVWDENYIRMYIDRETHPDVRPYFEMRILDNMGGTNCFRKDNFLLLNLAVGGNFPGIHNIESVTALNGGQASMMVDYVRVFQKKSSDDGFPALGSQAEDEVNKQKKSSKRGIATNFRIGSMPDLLGPGVSWVYDWGDIYNTSRWTALERNYMTYYPMGWNNVPDKARVEQHATRGSEFLLGFNEPNLRDQANLSPAEAARRWTGMVDLADATNMKLVSPAMNYGTTEGYGDPLVWLDEFFARPGVSLDHTAAISGHAYMPNTAGVKSFVRRFSGYGKPFWLTEFCHASGTISTDPALHSRFMSEIITYLEADPAVGKYSWFMDCGVGDEGGNCALIDWVGRSTPVLNDLGLLYIGASSLDKTTFYGVGENIPAEHYSDSSASAHAAAAEGWTATVMPFVTSDTRGLLEIGLGAGCWVEYQVDVPSDGDYRFDFRYAAASAFEMTLSSAGGDHAIATTATGSDKTWRTAGVKVAMTAGRQNIRLTRKSGSARLNWIRLTSKSV